jgi:AraC-like DNA-binding protein
VDKLIIILAVIHAYAFAVMLFAKKKPGARILGIYMLNFFIQSFLFANFHIFNINGLNIYFYLSIASLSLLDWPLIFFYIRKMSVNKYRFKPLQILHFLPATIFLVWQFIEYLKLPKELKSLLANSYELLQTPELEKYNLVYAFSIIFIFAQVIFYSIAIIIQLRRHRRNIENYYSFKENISLNWLHLFVAYYLLYYLVEILIYYFFYGDISDTFYYAIISIHVFFIGLFGLNQREIYDDKPEPEPQEAPTLGAADNPIKEKLIKEVKKEVVAPQSQEVKKSSQSISANAKNQDENATGKDQKRKQALLSEDLTKELADKISEIVVTGKLYLNQELSLTDLANELEIHKNYVSYVINEVHNMNFYNYINQYRIEEAKKMLLNPKYSNWSVEGVAKSCGFKSRNVFYPIFKKMVGETPKDFKLRHFE